MDRKAVAVMQPYFFPYAGYFRLFASVDQFVILDSVQFPRRGRVHRSQVPGPSGSIEWLTLPLARQPRETLIRELEFARGARDAFDRRLAHFGWIAHGTGPASQEVRDFLYQPLGSVIDYLEGGLRLVTRLLGLEVPLVRSSMLAIDGALRGQQRIIAIARAVGATRYVNPPGGREIYDREAFEDAGLELHFLQPYTGPFVHLLPGLIDENPDCIREDVTSGARLIRA